jgi:hypothetical protein
MPRTRIHNRSLVDLIPDVPIDSTPPSTLSRDASLRKLDQMQRNLAIERDSLERSCMKQPDFLYEVAEQVAQHRSRRDAIKKELEEKEASLYISFRHNASVREERVTEAEIKAQMTVDRAHQVLTNQLAEANELLARWEVLKEAFSQRSYMLRELVQLYLARYYGDPARSAETRMREFASERTREYRRENAQQPRFRNGGD